MSDLKVISIDRYRAGKKRDYTEKQHLGIMVWLHCPKCDTIEYTEIVAPYGRVHSCGTQVEESNVELDIRAELTITRYNIEKIDRLIQENSKFTRRKLFAKSLDKAFTALRKSEEIYLKRLRAHDVPSYPGNIEDLKDKLPIREVNELGLLVSEFRYKPENRFVKKSKGTDVNLTPIP